MATPGLIARKAQRLQGAIDAPRFAGNTNLAPVVDHLVGEGDPTVLGNDLHQVLFHLDWLGGLGQFKAPR